MHIYRPWRPRLVTNLINFASILTSYFFLDVYSLQAVAKKSPLLIPSIECVTVSLSRYLFYSYDYVSLSVDYAGDFLILCGDMELHVNQGPTSGALIMSDHLLLIT